MAQSQWTAAIDRLVTTASDEQLAGIVGPDSRFYTEQAVDAARAELDRRQKVQGGDRETSFHMPAMVFGPFWYLYHGMVGRGVLIAAFLVGASLGLEPVARSLGIPSAGWVTGAVFVVALYCGRFGKRDLEESRAQARAARNLKPEIRKQKATKPTFKTVAGVECFPAAESAAKLLKKQGIDAKVEGKEGDKIIRVLVPEEQLGRAAGLVQGLLEKGPECEGSSQ